MDDKELDAKDLDDKAKEAVRAELTARLQALKRRIAAEKDSAVLDLLADEYLLCMAERAQDARSGTGSAREAGRNRSSIIRRPRGQS